MNNENGIKFSICAMVDLLGFSSHLEISAYDLRTSIGKQAVSRLESLEYGIEKLLEEQDKYPDYYPSNLNIQRINDAVFITMDLDDILIPSVGSTRFQGLSSNDFDEFFSKEELENEDKFESAYQEKIFTSIEPVLKFVGAISRLYLYINKLEGHNHFPGAKSVIATGFRRPYVSKTDNKEDYFSANFALSNAYIAENTLKGPNFFIDNNVLQMLSYDKYTKNIVKCSNFIFKESYFNCFDDSDDVFSFSNDATIPNPIEIQLFRKNFYFNHLNPSPLSYLQQAPKILPFLHGKKKPNLDNVFFKHIFHVFKNGVNDKHVEKNSPPPSFIYNGTNDLDSEIVVFLEYLETGESKTKAEIAKQKILEEYSLVGVPEDDERYIKTMELLNKEVKVDFHPISIEEFKETIFSFSEEIFTSLKPMLEGDFQLLDYKLD